jgi:hypothetical protein
MAGRDKGFLSVTKPLDQFRFPPRLLFNVYGRLFLYGEPVVKRTRVSPDRPPAYSDKAEIVWSCSSTLPLKYNKFEPRMGEESPNVD